MRVGGQTCLLKDWSVVAVEDNPYGVMAAKTACIRPDERINQECVELLCVADVVGAEATAAT